MSKITDRIIFDCKASDRKILIVPVETIVATPYNPSARTKDGKKLRALADSIGKYGLIQPIVITADRDIVDGNRRLAASKIAGLSHVDCIILPVGVDKDDVFREVNTQSEKIFGRGWLEACRKGYRNPPPEVWRQYTELLSLVGTYGVDLLISKKLGLAILDQAKSAKSLGLVIRLDELVIKMAEGKLSNKINAIQRSSDSKEQKVKQIEELL